MTDKQIIIDGDSLLKLNDICIDCISDIDECECRKVAKDLYFKLSRKEQECEELKNCGNPSEIGLLSIENKKLKQALTEIKEIAEAHKKYIYVLPSYSVAGDSLEFSFEFTKEILQKISEVLDE